MPFHDLTRRLTQFKLLENSYKNHAYVLLSLQGDAALVAPTTPSPTLHDT